MSQLNKLTPDNFERISTKILEVGIVHAKTLRSLIDQVRPAPPVQYHVEGRFTGAFDRLPGQFFPLLDRLSDQLAWHWPRAIRSLAG